MFALGTFCIIISIIRLVSVRDSDSSQTIRSLWAAVQMFVSTFVANAPHIYGSIRAMRTKRRNGTYMARRRSNTNNRISGHVMSRRAQPDIDSWLKMDDEHLVPSALAAPAYMLRPLPQATTFFDENTAPAPYSHSPYLEINIGTSGSRSG
jgi:hypothetical protein